MRSKLLMFAIATAITSGSAEAAYTLQQLLQLIQKPTSIKSTDAGLNHLNGGVSAMFWEWGDPLNRGVRLTRLNSKPSAWQLDLSSKAYLLSKIAPQRQLLATITDPAGTGAFDLYLIKAGVFKGHYLQQQRFNDGRLKLSVVTKTYATIAIRASQLQRARAGQIYRYPLGAYLLYKQTFCLTPGALCR